MSISVGGAVVKRMVLTKSWGLTPASATITTAGTSSVAVQSSVALPIGGTTFYGVISSCTPKESRDGYTTEITALDNRLRLTWDTVYCVFNMVEVIEDDPTIPFVQRAKRFWHILPNDWHAQTKVYSRKPYTAKQICELLLNASTVNFGWSASYNAKFNDPVLGVDCNTGKKLGNALQEICDQLGVLMSIEGASQLIFATKGEGVAPQPSIFNSDDRASGSALGSDTKVRIVGDRNVYQDFPIDLEPDWLRSYERFWFKPAWIAEVQARFGILDFGEAAARAMEITLREYSGKAGVEHMDPGTWGDISRTEMPVWAYINDVVFKSYRIPRNFRINGVPLTSLALREGLLYGVKLTDPALGTIDYDPGVLYPDAKAFCIIKGLPLSLIRPDTYDAITPEMLAAASDTWSSVNRFSLDQKNYAVLFEEPIFFSRDLYIPANVGTEDGYLSRVVVPNAAAVIEPAQVRASLCFEAERYGRWFGSGSRQGTQYVQGLNYHTLFKDHSWKAEVTYDNDSQSGADALAAKAAAAFLTGQNFIESGGFTRYGTAGMALNGAIDRISVTLAFESGGEGEGISEQIEYAKERSPNVFQSERELERRSRVRDLFPGQSALREEAQKTRALARMMSSSRNPISTPIQKIDDVTRCLLGNPDASVISALLDSDFSYPVGMPVFVGDNNVVSATAERFAGCLTAAATFGKAGASIPVAPQGVVPCRVMGPVDFGDIVGVDDGESFAKKDGAKAIGVVQKAFTGESVMVVPVRLGGGGSSLPCWISDRKYPSPDDPDYDEENAPAFPARPGTHAVWFGEGQGSFVDETGCKISQFELDTLSNNHLFRFLAGNGTEIEDKVDGFIFSTVHEYDPENEEDSDGYRFNLAYRKGLVSLYTKQSREYVGLRVFPEEEGGEGGQESALYGFSRNSMNFLLFSGSPRFTNTGDENEPVVTPPDFKDLKVGLEFWNSSDDGATFHEIGMGDFGPLVYGFSGQYYHYLRSFDLVEGGEVPGASLQLFREAGAADYLNAFVQEDEVFIFSYSESGAWNFSATAAALGTEGIPLSEFRIWNANSIDYGSLRIVDGTSTLYGYANAEAWNHKLQSSNGLTKSWLQLFDADNTTYFESVVSNTKTNIFGYCDSEAWNFSAEANFNSAFSQLFDGENAQFLESRVDALSSAVYGYSQNQVYNFLLKANAASPFATHLTLWGESSNVYADLRLEAARSSLFGYANHEDWNYLIRATATESNLSLFNADSSSYSDMRATDANGGEIFCYGESEKYNFKYTKGILQVWGKLTGSEDAYFTLNLASLETIKAANPNAIMDIDARVINVCSPSKERKQMIVLASPMFDPPT